MSIVYNGSMDPRACKTVLPMVLQELASEDPAVVYLDADLSSCIGMHHWIDEHPTRGFNCGVAEANMIGVACGLAASGFKPFCHTFGSFASRRCFDQVFLSAGYAHNDITVIGTDPGVTASMNGGTHMPFEDIALYRTIPTATIIDITDPAMLMSILPQCKERPGVKYIRVSRKQYARVYTDGSELPIGKASVLRDGSDAAIFACGIMLHEALQAAQQLEKEGISVAVLDFYSIKPLDKAAIEQYARKTGAIVVAENHSKNGGLFDAVGEVLLESCPVPAACVAVEDCYGTVGTQAYLQEYFGLTSQKIISQVHSVLRRKKS